MRHRTGPPAVRVRARQRGWTGAPERSWSEEWERLLRGWTEALAEWACIDGLSVTCSVGWDPQIDSLYRATVRLNWPGGRPCGNSNRTSLPARLEQAWGETLVRARDQVEIRIRER